MQIKTRRARGAGSRAGISEYLHGPSYDARTTLERAGGYVWRAGKAFDLMKQPDEVKAEWARYLTLNERAERAYDDLRALEDPRLPAPLTNAPADYELRRIRCSDIETVRLTSHYHTHRTEHAAPAA